MPQANENLFGQDKIKGRLVDVTSGKSPLWTERNKKINVNTTEYDNVTFIRLALM
jgi:hypothetical protein